MGVPIWKKPTPEHGVSKKRPRRRETDLDHSLQGSLLRRVLPLLRADDTVEDEEVGPMGAGVVHHSASTMLNSRDTSGLWSFRAGGGNLQRRSSIHGRRDRIRRSLSPRTTLDVGNSNWSGWDSSLDLAEFIDGTGTSNRRRERRDSHGSTSSSSSSPSQLASTPTELQRMPSDLERVPAEFDRTHSLELQRALPRPDQSRPHPQLHRTRSSSHLSAHYGTNLPSSLVRGSNHQYSRRNSVRRPQVHFTVPVADSVDSFLEGTGFQSASNLLVSDGYGYDSDWWLSPYRHGPAQNDNIRRPASILESEERRWASRRLNAANASTTMSTSTLPDDNCPYNPDSGHD
jgi:hypothetical protein